MRISDWSSDVCSSDLTIARGIEQRRNEGQDLAGQEAHPAKLVSKHLACAAVDPCTPSGSCSRYGPARGEPTDNASEHVAGAASCKADARTEERRGGKGCVSTCRARCSRSQ